MRLTLGRRPRLAAIVIVVAALVVSAAAAAVAWTAVLQPAMLPPERPMPPLSAELMKLQDYYKFRFLPDGYPGKLEGGTVVAQPIYGRYVIGDYLRQYKRDPTPELREAILTVAHAAIDRMEPFGDALVFWYPEEMSISRQPEKHYSGLTQAYYAVVLHKAYEATGDEALREAAEQCFRSLLIPREDGGVYYEWEDGVALAEVPTSPRDLILNGWLSVLTSVHEYAELTGSPEARSLFDRSVATVAKLLPLYDAPDLRNSRYNLTGPVSLRLELDGSTEGVTVRDPRIDIPKEGSFELPVENGGRWTYWVNPDTARPADGGFTPSGSTVLMNVVLSRLPYPVENVVRFTVDTPRPLELTLAADVGSYDPLTSQQSNATWQPVETVQVPAGATDVEIPLPWKTVDLIAYPTNFIKKIGGKHTNVYHVIHIIRLRTLEEWTGNPVFGEWADRWQAYVCEWADMPIYDGLSVRDYRVSADELAADPASFCR